MMSSSSNGHSRFSEDQERLRIARRIVESTSLDNFDQVISDLAKVANLPEVWAEDMRSERASDIKHSPRASSVAARAAAAWNSFFHSRTGPDGSVLAARIRMAFAAIFVADRLLLTLDFDFFFSSTEGSEGMIAYMPEYYGDEDHSVFWLTPNNGWLLWTVHLLGILQALLLFLGVAPRFQALCLFLNLVNFHNYCDMIYDSQDVLQRTWAWMLCFLPLHRLTIYEWRQCRGMSPSQRKEMFRNDSWPMWPFRLFQIQICFIFIGAGLGKLSRPMWRDGTAMYRAIHQDNFFGGVFTPDILFNCALSLKIVTFVSLFLECTCFILIWPEPTRLPMVITMVLFHVGIDLSMNLNTFQWNMILGWLMFLAKPSAMASKATREVQGSKRTFLNVLLAFFIVAFYIHTSPDYFMFKRGGSMPFLPPALQTHIKHMAVQRMELQDQYIDPLMYHLGVSQQAWIMYSNPDNTNQRVIASINFYNGSIVEWSPQPDWKSMPWWQKKRYHRQMFYWDSITEDPSELCVKPLCLHLARMHGLDDVKSIKLRAHYEQAPPYPEGLGWFDEAKQPMIDLGSEFMYKWRNNENGAMIWGDQENKDDPSPDKENNTTDGNVCQGSDGGQGSACRDA